jgi:hypothetical protein
MKVIKVTSCGSCPYFKALPYGQYCYYPNLEIQHDNDDLITQHVKEGTIPDWCPLQTLEETIEA